MVAVGTTDPSEEDIAVLEAEYGPLCEAMYLMMSADGDIAREELEVLGGALRNLSGGVLDGDLIERLLETSKKNSETQGRDNRLRQVIDDLSKEKARAEVAFVLAACIAFADNTIADEENDTLDTLAEGLGIDEARADELLDAVEKDMSGAAS
jgi:tellurite resistance protein